MTGLANHCLCFILFHKNLMIILHYITDNVYITDKKQNLIKKKWNWDIGVLCENLLYYIFWCNGTSVQLKLLCTLFRKYIFQVQTYSAPLSMQMRRGEYPTFIQPDHLNTRWFMVLLRNSPFYLFRISIKVTANKSINYLKTDFYQTYFLTVIRDRPETLKPLSQVGLILRL